MSNYKILIHAILIHKILMNVYILIFGNVICSEVLQFLRHVEARSEWILYGRSLCFCFLIDKNLRCCFKRWCVAGLIVLQGTKNLKSLTMFVEIPEKLTVKVKCTLVQALRLCTGRTAHRGSRGIALLFLDHGTTKG